MKVNFFLDNDFVIAIGLVLLSLLSFNLKKTKLSLFFLFLSSLMVGLFLIKLDPFLHIWDEQFHALVAKNMIDQPFKPLLIKEDLFGYVSMDWSNSHVWLHKQPLFMWQIALSIKLFGANEIAVRVPSLIMHSLLILPVYRTGKIIFDKNTGYYTALFFTFCYFPLEFITGFYPTDHNDVAFFFYSFTSIWALIEYNHSPKPIFLILIGLLSGAAILCKWLTGLLVFGVWFLMIFSKKNNEQKYSDIGKLSLAFLICLLVFLPWQIYAYYNFPLEYSLSMNFNTRHIFEALEGHGGNYAFYYSALHEQYGEGLFIPPLMILVLLFTLYNIQNTAYTVILFSTVFITYMFFSLVATKMYGYVFVVFPIFILGLAFAFNQFTRVIEKKINNLILYQITTTLVAFLILILLFDSNKLYKHHSNKERAESRELKTREKQMYQSISEKFKNEKCILFNCNTSIGSRIPAMFYTNYLSINSTLTLTEIVKAKKLDYKLIAIDDGNLPDYILVDSSVVKIKFN